MITGRNIICLASSWGIDPTSKHQIMRRLAGRNRILWVNFHGSRRPRVNRRDVSRTLGVLCRVAGGTTLPMPGVMTITPLLLPVPGSDGVRSLNARLVAAQVRSAIKDWPTRPLQIWSFAPDVVELVERFEVEALVYYCVDEFAGFVGYDAQLIQRLERTLIAQCDLVLTSSERLHRKKRELHPETHLVRHGVDARLFGRALNKDTRVPAALDGVTGPVIGYFGLIDEWLDVELLVRLAAMRPAWTIVLVGGIGTGVGALRKQGNVRLMGRVDHSELPGYCRRFDVALIPFLVNDLTLSANPIKLREYLAAGLGVVSTPLPEVMAYSPHVRVGDSPEAFAAACEAVMAENSPATRRARAAAVANESWDGRVEEISALLERALRRGRVPNAV